MVDRIFVKESVFPFLKLTGSDILLGPEMKSTGEVMGISEDFGMAFAKSQSAAGFTIPTGGTVFISVNDFDKPGVLPDGARPAARWASGILATRGTAEFLSAHGVAAETVYKVNEGRPNCVDLIKSGQIDIIFNTPLGRESHYDDTRHPQERHPARRARGDHPDRGRGHRAGHPGPARALRWTWPASRRSTGEWPQRARAPTRRPREASLRRAQRRGSARRRARRGAAGAGTRRDRRVAGIAGVSGGALVAAAWAGGADLRGLVEQAARACIPGPGCAAGAAGCSPARAWA